jgi:hypothetical protein
MRVKNCCGSVHEVSSTGVDFPSFGLARGIARIISDVDLDWRSNIDSEIREVELESPQVSEALLLAERKSENCNKDHRLYGIE